MTRPAVVVEIDVADKRDDDETAPLIAFKLGGQIFPLHTLKMSMAMSFLSLIENDEMSMVQQAMQISSMLVGVIPYIQVIDFPEPAFLEDDDGNPTDVPNPLAGKARGQQRIRNRLADPLDPFDILDLKEVVLACVKAMYGDRPTTPSPESSERRQDDGVGSPEASPGVPAGTSGRSTPKRSSGSSKKR